MDRIEQRFNVDLAVLVPDIGIHLNEPSRQLLGIQTLLVKFGTIVKKQFAGNLFERSVEKHILTVKYDDRVYHILKVSHLVSRNHYCGIFRSVLENGRPELGLGRNVESVGRLVKEKILGGAGQGKRNIGLLQLTCGHRTELLIHVILEIIHYLHELVEREI